MVRLIRSLNDTAHVTEQDDTLAWVVIGAAAVIAAAIIASLLSQTPPEQRQNPEYLREQLIR